MLWERLAGLSLAVEDTRSRSSRGERRVRARDDAVPAAAAPARRASARTSACSTRTRPARRRAVPRAGGRMDARSFCRAPATRRAVKAAPPEWEMARAVAQLGVRVGGAGPGVAPGGHALPEPSARAAAAAVRQLARARRSAVGDDDRAAARGQPAVGFKLDAAAAWTPAIVDELAARARSRRSTSRAATGSRSRTRTRSWRMYDGCSRRSRTRSSRTRTSCRRSRTAGAGTRPASRSTRRSTRVGRHRPRARSTSSRRGSAGCGRCSRSTSGATPTAWRCTAAGWASSASGRGQIELLAGAVSSGRAQRRGAVGVQRARARRRLPSSPLVLDGLARVPLGLRGVGRPPVVKRPPERAPRPRQSSASAWAAASSTHVAVAAQLAEPRERNRRRGGRTDRRFSVTARRSRSSASS